MKLILVTIAIIVTFAQPILAVPTDQNKGIDPIKGNRSESISLLQAELDLTKSFQDKLLSTVYWSLGTIATLAVLLVGFGWYTNFKVYERDKRVLVEEINSLTKIELEKLRVAVDSHRNESSKLISEQIKKETNETWAPLEKQVKLLEDSFNKRIESRINEVQLNLFILAADLKEVEREKWIRQGVLSNALACSVEILKYAIHTLGRFQIARALDFVNEDLDKIRKSGSASDVPSADRTGSLTKLLNKLGPEHAIIVDSIREKTAKIHTK